MKLTAIASSSASLSALALELHIRDGASQNSVNTPSSASVLPSEEDVDADADDGTFFTKSAMPSCTYSAGPRWESVCNGPGSSSVLTGRPRALSNETNEWLVCSGDVGVHPPRWMHRRGCWSTFNAVAFVAVQYYPSRPGAVTVAATTVTNDELEPLRDVQPPVADCHTSLVTYSSSKHSETRNYVIKLEAAPTNNPGLSLDDSERMSVFAVSLLGSASTSG